MELLSKTIEDRAIQIIDNRMEVNGEVVDNDFKTISAFHDEKINPYIASFSDIYVIDVTERCNTNCKYCYYKVDNKSKDRSIASIIAEISEVPQPIVCLMGAEPTVREDLQELISSVVAIGKKVSITTNGIKLEWPSYVEGLQWAGLGSVNYSMHFPKSIRLGSNKLRVLRNLRTYEIPLGQLSFTISNTKEFVACLSLIEVLINNNYSPVQFVIRAGAAIGNCKNSADIYMSEMIKLAFEAGATKMPDGGSNLYFSEFYFMKHNLHLVRWPSNEAALPISFTGPTFGTKVGAVVSPYHQLTHSDLFVLADLAPVRQLKVLK